MPTQNLVSASLSAADAQAVLDAIATIRQKLPFLKAFTTEERQSLPKLGAKSRDFVGRALELGAQNLDSLPRGLDLDEARRDLALRDALLPLTHAVTQLAGLLQDTESAAGSDAYAAALVIYQSLRRNGDNTGLDDALDALGQRFAKKSRTTTATAKATTTTG